jgi:hypothetical protein
MTFIGLNLKTGTKAEIKKGTPYTCVDLPPLLSVEVTGVCLPNGKTEMLLATLYKFP